MGVGVVREPVPRYLLVDDSRAIRVVLADTLRKLHSSAAFVEAKDGEEALRAFTEQPRFDVVFLDLVMPGGLDGLAVLRSMLEIEPRTRIAIVTGLQDSANEVIGALSEGAFAYIRKPVTTDSVRHVLEKAARESGQAGTIR